MIKTLREETTLRAFITERFVVDGSWWVLWTHHSSILTQVGLRIVFVIIVVYVQVEVLFRPI